MKKSYISLDGGHVVSQYLVVVLMIPTGSPYEKNGRLPMDGSTECQGSAMVR